MDTKVCGFCKRGALVEDICGQLHVKTLEDGTEVAAHHKCMQYSALLIQYKSPEFGGFKISSVLNEIRRGKKLSCNICKARKKDHHPKTGATSGCALQKCNKTFHFYCANVDDTALTKRLVVNFRKREKKAVLYRVFCCQSHKVKYMEELRSEKEKLLDGSESSEGSSQEEDDTWDEAETEDGQETARSESPDELQSSPAERTKLSLKKKASKESEKSTIETKRKADDIGEPMWKRVRALKSSEEINNSDKIVTVKKKNGKFHLPKSLSPVVRLTADCSYERASSPASSADSELSGSTMSYGASSNSSESLLLEKQKHYIFPEVDLSTKVENVPKDSIALCVLSSLDSNPDSIDTVYNILENRYSLEKNSVYFWHKVVRNHGLLSEHILHFISDLTENLVEADMDRLTQWCLCPTSQGLDEKYKKIVDFQGKLEENLRHQLDHDISKTVFKNLRRISKALSRPVGELVRVGESFCLILLVNSKLGGSQELMSLFPPEESSIWAYPCLMLTAFTLEELQNMDCSLDNLNFSAEDIAEDFLALKRWCLYEMTGPVQVEVYPIEKSILCSPDTEQPSTAERMANFLNKIFTNPVSCPGNSVVLCVMNLDKVVVNPEEYLLRLLTDFIFKSPVACYAFLDVKSVDLNDLFSRLNTSEKLTGRRLEVLSRVDPTIHSPSSIIIKSSNDFQDTPPSSPDSTATVKENSAFPEVKQSCPVSSEDNNSSQSEGKNQYVEDGEIPSTSLHPAKKLKLKRTDSGNWITRSKSARSK